MSASTASRTTNGRVDVHEPSDYPIVLGDSLKSKPSSNSQFLRFRYNWEPRQGFSDQRGNLKRSKGSARLEYKSDKSGSSTYDYDAVTATDAHQDESAETKQFALIFDSEKSAYVLEQITQSFDLNLNAAHNQSRDEVRRHRQISSSRLGEQSNESNGANSPMQQDDDEADPANPYDFRNFLSEAKESAEKAVQQTGSRTPIPGSRTPLSGISSPSLAAGRFPPTTTTSFRPPPTSAPVAKKPPAAKPTVAMASRKQPVTKRKPIATKPAVPQPLSNEVVTDSSEDETQDTTTVSRTAASQAPNRGHARNVSSVSLSKSPNIVVTSGDLEIDMGSPTHEPRRRAMLDLDAFRSQTQTPTLPMRDNKSPRLLDQHDVEMPDRSDEEDYVFNDDDNDDDNNMNLEDDRSGDMDEDVDELALGSPVPKTSGERKHEIEKLPSPPTPSAPPTVDDDEDDFLAAELEKELGQDDQDDNPGNAYDDDESEISEEE